MRKIRIFFGLIITMVLLDMPLLSYAQPKVTKEKIPMNIPFDVRKQVERLYSLNPSERGKAAYELGEMREKAVAAVTFLVQMLSDFTEFDELIGGPIESGSSGTLADGKVTYMRSSSTEYSHSTFPGSKASDALVKIGKSAVEPLIASLNDEDPNIRKMAAKTLGNIGDPCAVDSLIISLKDENWDVRGDACYALGKIKNIRAVEPLVDVLKDEKPTVRAGAVWALGEIKDKRVLELLIVALKDKDKWVRSKTVEALGKIKDPRVVEYLLVGLNDEDSDVRWYVATALKEVTEKDFGEDVTKWQKWWEENKGEFSKGK